MVKRVRRKNTPKNKKTKNLLPAVAAVVGSALLAFIIYLIFENFLGNDEIGDFEGTKYAEYCRQVHLFMETDGKEGWSDYRNIYYKDCLGVKSKRGWR